MKTYNLWLGLLGAAVIANSVDASTDEDLPTYEGAVEVGTKTGVTVTANAYDDRPGGSSGQNGCGGEGDGGGCVPANTRDGVAGDNIESRWSCAPSLIMENEEGPCQIEYKFDEPQDIQDILVAFWRGDERVRTLDVYLDGEKTLTYESSHDSEENGFNTLNVLAAGVTTVVLESVGLEPKEWTSLIEVLIFVKPVEEPIPTVDGAVEVGTKTDVGVTANAHDVRAGRILSLNGCVGVGGDGCDAENGCCDAAHGCGDIEGNGCDAALTRDGVFFNDIESRWSCSPSLVEDGSPCQIKYTFDEPQDIEGIQVAFRKPTERVRTLKVELDGKHTGSYDSAESTFSTLEVQGSNVSTVMLEAVLEADEWISLFEVLFFVADS